MLGSLYILRNIFTKLLPCVFWEESFRDASILDTPSGCGALWSYEDTCSSKYFTALCLLRKQNLLHEKGRYTTIIAIQDTAEVFFSKSNEATLSHDAVHFSEPRALLQIHRHNRSGTKKKKKNLIKKKTRAPVRTDVLSTITEAHNK